MIGKTAAIETNDQLALIGMIILVAGWLIHLGVKRRKRDPARVRAEAARDREDRPWR